MFLRLSHLCGGVTRSFTFWKNLFHTWYSICTYIEFWTIIFVALSNLSLLYFWNLLSIIQSFHSVVAKYVVSQNRLEIDTNWVLFSTEGSAREATTLDVITLIPQSIPLSRSRVDEYNEYGDYDPAHSNALVRSTNPPDSKTSYYSLNLCILRDRAYAKLFSSSYASVSHVNCMRQITWQIRWNDVIY